MNEQLQIKIKVIHGHRVIDEINAISTQPNVDLECPGCEDKNLICTIPRYTYCDTSPYGGHVSCNICGRCDDIVFNCPNTHNAKQHPDGYDYCFECGVSHFNLIPSTTTATTTMIEDEEIGVRLQTIRQLESILNDFNPTDEKKSRINKMAKQEKIVKTDVNSMEKFYTLQKLSDTLSKPFWEEFTLNLPKLNVNLLDNSNKDNNNNNSEAQESKTQETAESKNNSTTEGGVGDSSSQSQKNSANRPNVNENENEKGKEKGKGKGKGKGKRGSFKISLGSKSKNIASKFKSKLEKTRSSIKIKIKKRNSGSGGSGRNSKISGIDNDLIINEYWDLMFNDIMDQINETQSKVDRLFESVRLYNAKNGFIQNGNDLQRAVTSCLKPKPNAKSQTKSNTTEKKEDDTITIDNEKKDEEKVNANANAKNDNSGSQKKMAELILVSDIRFLTVEETRKMIELRDKHNHKDMELNFLKLTLYKWDLAKTAKYYTDDEFCLLFCTDPRVHLPFEMIRCVHPGHVCAVEHTLNSGQYDKYSRITNDRYYGYILFRYLIKIYESNDIFARYPLDVRILMDILDTRQRERNGREADNNNDSDESTSSTPAPLTAEEKRAKMKKDLENGTLSYLYGRCGEMLQATFVRSCKLDLLEAERYFSKSIEFCSVNADAYLECASMLHHKLDSEECEKYYEKAINVFDNKLIDKESIAYRQRAFCYVNFGMYLLHSKKHLKAIECMENAIKISDSTNYHYFLSLCYYEAKQFSNAFEYVENALQLENEIYGDPSQLNDIFGMLTGKIKRKYPLSHTYVKDAKRMYHDCWVNQFSVINHNMLVGKNKNKNKSKNKKSKNRKHNKKHNDGNDDEEEESQSETPDTISQGGVSVSDRLGIYKSNDRVGSGANSSGEIQLDSQGGTEARIEATMLSAAIKSGGDELYLNIDEREGVLLDQEEIIKLISGYIRIEMEKVYGLLNYDTSNFVDIIGKFIHTKKNRIVYKEISIKTQILPVAITTATTETKTDTDTNNTKENTNINTNTNTLAQAAASPAASPATPATPTAGVVGTGGSLMNFLVFGPELTKAAVSRSVIIRDKSKEKEKKSDDDKDDNDKDKDDDDDESDSEMGPNDEDKNARWEGKQILSLVNDIGNQINDNVFEFGIIGMKVNNLDTVMTVVDSCVDERHESISEFINQVNILRQSVCYYAHFDNQHTANVNGDNNNNNNNTIIDKDANYFYNGGQDRIHKIVMNDGENVDHVEIFVGYKKIKTVEKKNKKDKDKDKDKEKDADDDGIGTIDEGDEDEDEDDEEKTSVKIDQNLRLSVVINVNGRNGRRKISLNDVELDLEFKYFVVFGCKISDNVNKYNILPL